MTDIVALVQCTALITAAFLLWAYIDTVARNAWHRHRANSTTRNCAEPAHPRSQDGDLGRRPTLRSGSGRDPDLTGN